MDNNHKTGKSPEKLSYAIYRHQKSITPWIPDSRSLSVKLGFRIPKPGFWILQAKFSRILESEFLYVRRETIDSPLRLNAQ